MEERDIEEEESVRVKIELLVEKFDIFGESMFVFCELDVFEIYNFLLENISGGRGRSSFILIFSGGSFIFIFSGVVERKYILVYFDEFVWLYKGNVLNR